MAHFKRFWPVHKSISSFDGSLFTNWNSFGQIFWIYNLNFEGMKIVSNNSLFYLEEDILFKGPIHRPHARGWDQFNKLTYKFTSNCKLFTSILQVFSLILTQPNWLSMLLNQILKTHLQVILQVINLLIILHDEFKCKMFKTFRTEQY